MKGRTPNRATWALALAVAALPAAGEPAPPAPGTPSASAATIIVPETRIVPETSAQAGPAGLPLASSPLEAAALAPLSPLPAPSPMPPFAAWLLSGPPAAWQPFSVVGTLAAAEGAKGRTGHDVLEAFQQGLAQPDCEAGRADARWLDHFAHAPALLAAEDGDVLGLFGHVVDALRQAHLPTEFALIPFVESGYRADARSASGPAGLWQFIPVTARNHRVPIRPGYDGRLSPVHSTRAAVRYLKTLYGMFGGNWRLAAMAFNAGEHRVLHAMRRAGASAVDARPAELPGLPAVTQAYVEKLHALACVIDDADRDPDYRNALNREVPPLR